MRKLKKRDIVIVVLGILLIGFLSRDIVGQLFDNQATHDQDVKTLKTFSYVDTDLVGTSCNEKCEKTKNSKATVTTILPIDEVSLTSLIDGQPDHGYDNPNSEEMGILFKSIGGSSHTEIIEVKYKEETWEATINYASGKVTKQPEELEIVIPQGYGWKIQVSQIHRIRTTKVDNYVDDEYVDSTVTIETLGYSIGADVVKMEENQAFQQ